MRSFFIAIIAVYAILFFIHPQLGPTDDFVFLRTLQVGKPLLYFSSNFPYYDTWALGRFGLLSSIEYNLFWLFSDSPSPFWYFLYHAIQFILFIIIFLKLIENFSQNKLLNYLITFLLIFLPGFTIAWFRLQLPERNVIFFFAAFLLAYLAYLKRQKIIYLVATVLFANIAIYYKEITFLTIGAFAFSHLALSWKGLDKKIKILDVSLILSALIYAALFYFLVFQSSSLLYLPRASNPALVFIKNIVNYAFFSDPALILILLPLVFWRGYKVLIRCDEIQPLADPMLAAGSAYVFALFLLNIYGPYYLLPVYAFAIPSTIYFFKNYSLKSIPVFFKIAGALTVLLFIFNTIPAGIHYLTYNKYLPINFNKALDFLVQDINARHKENPDEKPSIFLVGVDRGPGRGTHSILAHYLKFRGIEDEWYDMKSEVAAKDVFSSATKIRPPFTVFKAGPALEPQPGDYLILTPQTTENINNQYIKSLKKDYALVFETESILAFPNWNLKTLLKYIILKKSGADKNGSGVIRSENLLNWSDYYILVKRELVGKD